MRGLGTLEAAVMEVLWRTDEPLPVRGVLDQLDTGKALAYTTVMTILDNLHGKGFVVRVMTGRAYHYTASASREATAAAAIRQILAEAGNPEAALLHFAATASDDESKLLRSGLNRRKRRSK